MKNYRIIVKNGANAEIYNDIIRAESENKALKEFLERNEIFDCDTIRIEVE